LIPDYETIKDEIVWRCIAMRTFSGGMSWAPHSEFLYDDYMLTDALGRWFREIADRGDATKITVHRVGPFSQVLGSPKKQRSGTSSIIKQRKIVKLETFV